MEIFSVELVLAYFDPGSGSLILQTLVGGAAGILVFGKYLWVFVKDRLVGCCGVSVSGSRGDATNHPGSDPTQRKGHD